MGEETRIVFMTAHGLLIGPMDDGSIGMEPVWPPEEIGLTPGTRLVLRMSPTEARQIAQRLHSIASEAEAKSRPS